MLRILLLLVLSIVIVSCQMTEEELALEQAPDEQGRDISGHIAVIRPDYTLWKMVKVLKNMFDSRTEKRRQRDLDSNEDLSDVQAETIRQQALRARRLHFNF